MCIVYIMYNCFCIYHTVYGMCVWHTHIQYIIVVLSHLFIVIVQHMGVSEVTVHPFIFSCFNCKASNVVLICKHEEWFCIWNIGYTTWHTNLSSYFRSLLLQKIPYTSNSGFTACHLSILKVLKTCHTWIFLWYL